MVWVELCGEVKAVRECPWWGRVVWLEVNENEVLGRTTTVLQCLNHDQGK